MHFTKIYYPFLLVLSIAASCRNHSDAEKNKALPKDTIHNTAFIDSSLTETDRLKLIEQLIQGDNYALAIAHTNYLLKKDPNNPAWFFIKADALERKKDTALALQYYLKADSIAGKFPQARLAILNIYAETLNPATIPYAKMMLEDPASEKIHSNIMMMKAIYLTKTGNIHQAEALYTSIMKQDYTFMQAYIEKGLLYYDQQQYKKALELFQRSTEVKNDFADGYFWIGKAYNKLNEKASAVLHFKKALALDPSIQEAREELKTLGAIQ